jgi:hypothetical protein
MTVKINRSEKFIDLPALSLEELEKITRQLNQDYAVDLVIGMMCEMNEEGLQKVRDWLAEE